MRHGHYLINSFRMPFDSHNHSTESNKATQLNNYEPKYCFVLSEGTRHCTFKKYILNFFQNKYCA